MKEQTSPRGNRMHIALFGRTNSGKSSLLNALTNQDTSIVSNIAGTTTDLVYKAMELHGVGAVTFIDTAGFGDDSTLGDKRLIKTQLAIEQCDLAIILFTNEAYKKDNFLLETDFVSKFVKNKKLFLPILNKADQVFSFTDDRKTTDSKTQTDVLSFLVKKIEECVQKAKKLVDTDTLTKETLDQQNTAFATENILPIVVSATQKKGIQELHAAIRHLTLSQEDPARTESLVPDTLCKKGDTVLLVMPQDIQAPKGRLILPQVQVLRALLDKSCIAISCTVGDFCKALDSLKRPPQLIITDSQVFKTVFEKKPPKTLLTSFSILFAAEKGNIASFVEGATAIESLSAESHILIAEACTHAPLAEDIGREKIPCMLRAFLEKKHPGAGKKLTISHVRGTDFPSDLSSYSLIIHCGGCMFNRAYMLSRQHVAQSANIPMTNYGVCLAYLAGILNNVALP